MAISIFDIQRATLAARQRTGDNGIGTRVEAGRVQVVRVEYVKRKPANVTPLSAFVTAAEAVEFLNSL